MAKDVEAKDAEPAVRVTMLKQEASSSHMLQLLLGKDEKTKDSAIEPPPIDPIKLAALYDLSGILRPNVEAYITNIDAQGHHFEPAIDLNAPDAHERVSDSLFVEALLEAQAKEEDLEEIGEPDDDAVKAMVKSLRRTARLELARARSFFTTCTPDGTFTDLRKATRQDLEITGDGYWEVLRGNDGLPRTLHRAPAVTMRIAKQTHDIAVPTRRQVTDLLWETVQVRRTFKRFVEVDFRTEIHKAWFKEFGDPRIVSRKTGTAFDTEQEMVEAEGADAQQATEIFHFEIPSLVSLYGMPRWVGNLPGVLGSRELDEVNLDYFLSNAVPALAILVAGGRFGKGVEERLKEFFEEEVRGKRATHKLICLEAETQRRSSQGPSAVPRIEIVPLRTAQVQDALFQNYDSRNITKVGASFRLPNSFASGQITLADLRLAEDQVFQPERAWFDDQINKFFMPELKIRFWTFASNTIMTRDPEVVGKLALMFGEKGFLLPAEVRKIAERVFKENFPTLRQKWVATPMPFTLAAFGLKAGPAEAVREQGRQAGDGTPLPEDLLADLALDPEEASVTPRDEKKPEGQALEALEALPGLGAGDPSDNE